MDTKIRKTLGGLIFFFLMLWICVNYLFQTDNQWLNLLRDALWIILGIGQIMGYIYLYQESEFKNSFQFRGFKLAVGFFLIGLMFKIQHWPFALAFIIIGTLSVLISYSWYIITTRTMNNRMHKWLWLILASVVIIGIFQHWISAEFRDLPFLMFWVMILRELKSKR